MNSKERVREAVLHRETDRLPINFKAREEIVQSLYDHFGICDEETLLRRLRVDLRRINPTPRCVASPYRYADPTVSVRRDPASGDEVYYDIWGVGFMRKCVLGAEYLDLAYSPLRDACTLDDLERYPFPEPDLWDYNGLRDIVARHREYCVWAHTRGFFEIAWMMRGMENFLTDLLIAPEYAGLLMERIIAYLEARTVRILEQDREGLIDFVEINDDVGGQDGLLISPDLWRQFIKPRMRRLIDRLKGYGVLIRYHCCGGLREIIPDLIEIGVDILNPVQPLARGMALEGLKRDFGHLITFNGGIDTQELLPQKRGAAFKEEIRRILRLMGRGGGYIMESSHAIQVDVPLENVLLLYELAAEPRGGTGD